MGGRRRRNALLVAALVCFTAPSSIAVAAPTAHPPAADDSYADPSRELGATSPSCRYALDALRRRACRQSGSALQPHPLSSYGLDVRAGFSITDPGKTFMGALQSVGAAVWMALLYAIKGVLLLLEWAFSLDLTNQAMPQARRSLEQLHARVFGDEWLLLAISAAGLWGMWRGLVQRRTSETLAGLAATVGLIVLGLVVIARPGETIGRGAQLANEAGVAVLAATTNGNVDHPRLALTDALAGVFDTTVRQPWCALQFGSLAYCDHRTGDAQRPTYAELWLHYPAQSWQRGRLHAVMKGDDGGGFDPITTATNLVGLTDGRDLPADVKRLVSKDPDRARMQEVGGTFPRLALLATIAVGLLGAAALYAYIGVRLLLASAMTLLLLLIAPAMLLAPGLGDSGRATFLGWVKRLVGAVAAKLVYAVFLAVVLAVSRIFVGLDLGWFGTWLLLGAFWWGVFVKRHEIFGFVSAGLPRSEHGGIGQSLTQGYYAWMLGRAARQGVARTLRPARAGVGALRLQRAEGREARIAATSALARERFDDHGRGVLANEQAAARQVVAQRAELQQELQAVDRRLRGYDETVASARASGAAAPAATSDQRDLLRHRERLRALIDDPTAREAVETTRHAERNQALTGDGVSSRDLEVYRARRAAELRDGLPLDDDRNLRGAGIDPQEYREATAARREELVRHARDAVALERDLLDAIDGHPPAGNGSRRWLDHAELRERTAEERARLREERRRRRAREGVFRRR